MSYVKNTWAVGDIINAEKLNHMEDGIAAGGGADWDAEEGESGFIDNKPFYSTIESYPDLPKTYVDNLAFTAKEDLVSKIDITDEEWLQAIGTEKSKCAAGTGIIINFKQAKEFYPIFFGDGDTYPGDEVIKAKFGSLEAFGKETARKAKEEFSSQVTVPITYIHDFSYTSGQMPDFTALIDPSFSASIKSIEVSSAPTTIHKSIAPLLSTNAVDVWGNTGIFNGHFIDIVKEVYGDSEYTRCLNQYISHATSDKYYFAICTLSYGGMYPVYWYDLAFEDTQYFTKTPYTDVVPHDWDAIEGAAEGYQRYKTFVKYKEGRYPEATFKYNNTETSGSVYCAFPYCIYGNGMTDDKIPDYLYFKTSTGSSSSISPSGSMTEQFVEKTGTFGNNFQNGNTITITCEIDEDNESDVAYIYVDVPAAFSLITEETGTSVSSTFNYALTSASQEIIEYLDDKFIEKPDWWFGEKNYIISTPTSTIKNIASPNFGGL